MFKTTCQGWNMLKLYSFLVSSIVARKVWYWWDPRPLSAGGFAARATRDVPQKLKTHVGCFCLLLVLSWLPMVQKIIFNVTYTKLCIISSENSLTTKRNSVLTAVAEVLPQRLHASLSEFGQEISRRLVARDSEELALTRQNLISCAVWTSSMIQEFVFIHAKAVTTGSTRTFVVIIDTSKKLIDKPTDGSQNLVGNMPNIDLQGARHRCGRGLAGKLDWLKEGMQFRAT